MLIDVGLLRVITKTVRFSHVTLRDTNAANLGYDLVARHFTVSPVLVLQVILSLHL